jgi:hypothetical protein
MEEDSNNVRETTETKEVDYRYQPARDRRQEIKKKKKEKKNEQQEEEKVNAPVHRHYKSFGRFFLHSKNEQNLATDNLQ